MKKPGRIALLAVLATLLMYTAQAQPVFKELRLESLKLPDTKQPRQLNITQAVMAAQLSNESIAASCFVVGNSCSVVPLTLLDFTAVRLNDESAGLTWHTTAEAGVLGFYTERSLDPRKDFISRGFVVSAGSQAIKNEYRFTDPNDLTVKSYYRLRVAHADGHFTFSEIKSVMPVKETTALVVFPNPAADLLNIRIRVNKNTAATILLQDAAGRRVMQWSKNLLKGSNLFPENITNLAAGSYRIIVQAAELPAMTTSFFKY